MNQRSNRQWSDCDRRVRMQQAATGPQPQRPAPNESSELIAEVGDYQPRRDQRLGAPG